MHGILQKVLVPSMSPMPSTSLHVWLVYTSSKQSFFILLSPECELMSVLYYLHHLESFRMLAGVFFFLE